MSDEQDERNHQTNSDDLGSDPDVPIVHVPPPEHPHHPTEETRHSHHYIKRAKEFIREHRPSSTVVSTFASVVTALATVWMVVVYIQISGIMQSSSGQTDKLIEAADIQACAAQKIANASDKNAAAAKSFSDTAVKAVTELKRGADNSKRSIEESTKNATTALDASTSNLQTELRPWLYTPVVQTDGTNHGDAVDLGSTAIAVKNTGRTPAVNVRGVAMLTMGDFYEEIPDFDAILKAQGWTEESDVEFQYHQGRKPFAMIDRFISGQIIPPGDNAFGFNFNFVQDNTVKRESPRDHITLAIFLMGRIRYGDAFGPKQHTTAWCFVQRLPGERFLPCAKGWHMD